MEVIMFSHVILGTNDIEQSKTFYNALLGALGANLGVVDDKGRLMFMHDGKIFGLTPPIDGQPATHGNGSTIGFACSSSEQVEAWHAAGVANGGQSIEDPPGVRESAFCNLYLAYLRDPAGNKLCALHQMG